MDVDTERRAFTLDSMGTFESMESNGRGTLPVGSGAGGHAAGGHTASKLPGSTVPGSRARRRAMAFVVAGAAAAVLVAGCSSSNSSATGSSSNTASDASAAASSSALPSFPAVAENASMTLNTNQGTIVIGMDPAAKVTDASMAYLANKGYFNNTSCHRLTTQGIYVLQCGDPTGTGSGDPGYEIPDENLPTATSNNYPKGTVAMANAGPNTNGSQFFIVYQDTELPPNYTIWGKVTQGMDVVEKVAAAGVQGGGTDGPPAMPVTIQTATVK